MNKLFLKTAFLLFCRCSHTNLYAPLLAFIGERASKGLRLKALGGFLLRLAGRVKPVTVT